MVTLPLMATAMVTGLNSQSKSRLVTTNDGKVTVNGPSYHKQAICFKYGSHIGSNRM